MAIEDPRRLLPGQRLAAEVLVWAKIDLSRPPSCFRHVLAQSWVVGEFPCGCPSSEMSGLPIGLVADLLRADPEEIRRGLLNGTQPVPAVGRCRAPRR